MNIITLKNDHVILKLYYIFDIIQRFTYNYEMNNLLLMRLCFAELFQVTLYYHNWIKSILGILRVLLLVKSLLSCV